jgi:hypothetical protein
MTRLNRTLLAGGIVFVAVAIAVSTLGIRSFGSDAAEPEDNGISFVPPSDSAPPRGEGTLTFTADGFAATPRRLSADECSSAQGRMEAQAKIWAAAVEKVEGDKTVLRGQLAAAVADSREWFAAGCPQHPVLGYYDATNGSGAIKSILIDFP